MTDQAFPRYIDLHHTPPEVNRHHHSLLTHAFDDILAMGGRASGTSPKGSSSSTKVTLRTLGELSSETDDVGFSGLLKL